MAMGIDRVCMFMADETNIREVIAFPKNQRGVDLMFDAPTLVDQQQLDDVGSSVKPKPAAALPSSPSPFEGGGPGWGFLLPQGKTFLRRSLSVIPKGPLAAATFVSAGPRRHDLINQTFS